jgi:hypothetical protein
MSKILVNELAHTNNTSALAVNSNGLVTKPALPAFYVHPTNKQTNIAVNSNVTVIFDNEVQDQGGNFASNGFTAPVNGFYHFSTYLRLENIDSAAGYYLLQWQIGGTNLQAHLFDPDFGQDNTYFAMNSSLTYYVTAGTATTLLILQSGGTSQTDIDDDSWFSGHLVG